jgi:hypothetical protein
MKKAIAVLTFLGVTVIIIGLVFIYLGTQKAQVTTTEASYSFDGNYLRDNLINETYLRGGDFTIQDCKSDTLEIVAIHPPVSFNQSKLANVYFAVWEGGIKPSLPGNRPDKIIPADLISEQTPDAFMFDLRVNTLSIELLSNETYENLGSSSAWNADFIRIHALPASPDFLRLGIVLPNVGMAVVLLMMYLLDRHPTISGKVTSDKTGEVTAREKGEKRT